MSISLITNINLPNRAERINAIDNRIVANNRQIAVLEKQISAQKEVSTVIREQVANNTDTINLTKELIVNNEKSIKFLQETQVLAKENRDLAVTRLNNLKETQVLAKENRDLAETRLNNLKETQVLAKENRDLAETRLNNLKKTQVLAKENRDLAETRLNNLKETQVLAKENRDLAETRLNNLKETQVLAKKAVDCVEKMLAIMMKNPAKYGGLNKDQLQQLPEVMEVKNKLTDNIAVKLNQYPKEERTVLMDTAKKVIDRSFHEIKPTDLSSNKKIFLNLEKNIDTALAEQYTLVKDEPTIRNYRIIQKLFHNFSSLSIRNLKA